MYRPSSLATVDGRVLGRQNVRLLRIYLGATTFLYVYGVTFTLFPVRTDIAYGNPIGGIVAIAFTIVTIFITSGIISALIVRTGSVVGVFIPRFVSGSSVIVGFVVRLVQILVVSRHHLASPYVGCCAGTGPPPTGVGAGVSAVANPFEASAAVLLAAASCAGSPA